MLLVYAGLDLIECDRRARLDIPSDCIDMSKTSVTSIASGLRTICQHHSPGKSVYIGFLDPLIMLSPPDEVLCRQAFRTMDVYIVVSNPFILPFSWKNGTSKLIIIGEHEEDAEDTKVIDDGRSAHVSGFKN